MYLGGGAAPKNGIGDFLCCWVSRDGWELSSAEMARQGFVSKWAIVDLEWAFCVLFRLSWIHYILDYHGVSAG